ncbi:MAG TPA: tetratricopeptide repeat protein [Chthoniobacteraceae bacterium]
MRPLLDRTASESAMPSGGNRFPETAVRGEENATVTRVAFPFDSGAGWGRTLFRMSVAILLSVAVPLQAAELSATQQLVRSGEYAKAIAEASQGLRENPEVPDWPLVLGEALTQVGRLTEARKTLVQAGQTFPFDLRLRLAGYHALRTTGAAQEAGAQLAELERLAMRSLGRSGDPGEQVALGRIALLLGGDPKVVIDEFFEPVRKANPNLRDSYLASGELALEKNDFALAAKKFTAATAKFPNDADLWFGLARAYAPSDSKATVNALEKTLEFNPNHPGAHLLLADQHIDTERYGEADAELAKVLKINPQHALAHASRAVLAHLRADEKAEREARADALKSWPTNPEVPHLIGRKLSQKYRFAEGAALQREALKFDRRYLPAKAQLANDLLRLGRDEEGWELAEQVQKSDPYDVVAYNLTTLRDVMAKFRTLTTEHFLVRMEPREAEVYGAKVLALLERAHASLTRKYGLQPRERTIVEIFPNQKDFAIRTFGLPGGDGYLGVCFGRVITAVSPAARQGSPNNWEAVLWHEFAHVVTLTLTRNKMPRWLSEGISVYEERLARGSWGEQMKPRYRAMILGADLTPISQLSAAFLKPKTPAHIGFAYYESSLAVEWLMERWGVEKMKRLLADLARGVEINAALASNFAPIEKLDAEFATHAQTLAKNTGPKLDWTPPPAEVLAKGVDDAWIEKNPENFVALTERARQLIEQRKWKEAKAPLQKLIALYPNQHEPDSAYALLAQVHRELKETEAELEILKRLAQLAANATGAYQRLIEISAERGDWAKTLEFVEQYQAVNPLRPEVHRQEAEALEATGNKPAAIAAYRTLLQLNPPEPAKAHLRLAQLLHATGDSAARRHVLLALEEAPRYRAAHELLLKIPARAAEAKGNREVPALPQPSSESRVEKAPSR